MDIEFDRTSDVLSIKDRTVSGDATYEVKANVPQRVMGDNQLVQILENPQSSVDCPTI